MVILCRDRKSSFGNAAFQTVTSPRAKIADD